MDNFARIQEIIFELSEMKTKARTSEEYELADAGLQALLKVKWEQYCKKSLIFVKTEKAA